jgi:hypothetical protein
MSDYTFLSDEEIIKWLSDFMNSVQTFDVLTKEEKDRALKKAGLLRRAYKGRKNADLYAKIGELSTFDLHPHYVEDFYTELRARKGYTAKIECFIEILEHIGTEKTRGLKIQRKDIIEIQTRYVQLE